MYLPDEGQQAKIKKKDIEFLIYHPMLLSVVVSLTHDRGGGSHPIELEGERLINVRR